HEYGRREEDRREGGGDRGGEDAAVEESTVKEPVADRTAGQGPADRADADDEQEDVRERLADRVLLFHEFGAEGQEAPEEVVAARARGDEDDVRADGKHVARRSDDGHTADVALEHEFRIGLDAGLA